ncbi:MAG: hypothetical protein GF334_06730, partial [Candidatus Altiarchaeales archaeon]|nr:hypothetical protein [Candidatus Altiarchaeales archaeon]
SDVEAVVKDILSGKTIHIPSIQGIPAQDVDKEMLFNSYSTPNDAALYKFLRDASKMHNRNGNHLYEYDRSEQTYVPASKTRMQPIRSQPAQVKYASKIQSLVIKSKNSKKPTVFLGGECGDKSWREEVKKEFGDRLFFIDPYDKDWDAEDNIYDELAGIAVADHIIFFKSGEGSKKEKKFLDIITPEQDYESFSDLGKLKVYLENLSKPVVKKACVSYLMRKHAFSLMKISKKGKGYSLSSTQIDMPEDFAKEVMAWTKKNITDDKVHDDGDKTCGREDEIHATLFYGLEDEDPDKVAEILKDVAPFEVRLGLVTAFKDQDDYDVLKVDVESPEMQRLHYLLEDKLPNKNSYPTYAPHMTLAFVQKDSCDNFLGDETFKDKKFKVKEIIFSSKNGKKTPIKLEGK